MGNPEQLVDWRKKHANDSEKALEHPIVKDVIEELTDNLRNNPRAALDMPDLLRYSITKVAAYTAQVARAQALGFNPDLLRMNDSEMEEEVLRRVEAAVAAGHEVLIIADSSPEGG